MDFGRLITAMVTPFDGDMKVDGAQFLRLIDYLINEQQTDSIVVNGTTGESPTLTEEEKLGLFEAAVRHANGRCKIIAGTGSNDTADAVYMSKEAEKRGVDALLHVAPFYNRPSQEGLYQHFKAIAEAVNIPIMIYNVPSRTGVNINAETTIRLSKIPNIVATKDCASPIQLTQIVAGAEPGFSVYSGDDSMALPALSVGARGIVSVASHIIGKEMKAMIQAYFGGNVAEAAKLHGKLMPIFEGLFCAPSPAPVKYALNRKGIQVGGVRLPLIDLSDAEAKFVDSIIG